MANALGIARTTYLACEKDGKDIKVSILKKISDVTGESLTYLAEGGDNTEVDKLQLKLYCEASIIHLMRLYNKL